LMWCPPGRCETGSEETARLPAMHANTTVDSDRTNTVHGQDGILPKQRTCYFKRKIDHDES